MRPFFITSRSDSALRISVSGFASMINRSAYLRGSRLPMSAERQMISLDSIVAALSASCGVTPPEA